MSDHPSRLLHRERLLGEINSVLQGRATKGEPTDPGLISIVLYDSQGEEIRRGDLLWLLDCAVNDLYFDEVADWHDAYSLRVTS